MPLMSDPQRQPLLSKKSETRSSGKTTGKPAYKTISSANTTNPKSPSKTPAGNYPVTAHIRQASSSTVLSSDEESLYVKDPDDFRRYFGGPLPVGQYSRIPFFMRLRGSILPKMLVQLTVIGFWSYGVCYLVNFRPEFAVSNVLMGTLVAVAVALSIRSTTAYGRYGDGRRAWARLGSESRNMARLIWLHTSEREGELGKEDLLSKLTAINLIVAYAVALKHRLRFEPHTQYADLKDAIDHLHTFAHEAYDREINCHRPHGYLQQFGEFLGLAIAQSDPREALTKSKKPLGNLPLEILNHLSVWTQVTQENGNMKMPRTGGSLMSGLAALTEVLAETERVLNTPLPLAYNIAFSQITILYVYALPFQLYDSLGWLTIPGTVMAAYIILGLAAIGDSLENPFGHDNNALDLDSFCEELRAELDVVTATPPPKYNDFVNKNENLVLAPLSRDGFADWMGRERGDIYDALKAKSLLNGRRTVDDEAIKKLRKKRKVGAVFTA